MEMHWGTVWESVADVIPDNPAITNGDVTRNWAEYDERAARVASALQAAGIEPHAKVALYLYNGNEYLEAQFGTFKMRGVVINVNYRYLDEELWYLLDNADADFFVRQHYLDFLGREPDAAGLAFWKDQITSCGANAACIEVRRINVSAAFFLSIEFQETGFLVYKLYKAGYGNLPGAPVPVSHAPPPHPPAPRRRAPGHRPQPLRRPALEPAARPEVRASAPIVRRHRP